MAHRLSNSEYIFTQNYSDKLGRDCKATVMLKVNHNDGSYIVLPSGTAKNEFGFVSNSKHNYELWKTILLLIESAVEYGESLVNPPDTIEDVLGNIDTPE